MWKYYKYRLLRLFHLISKKKYKEKTAKYTREYKIIARSKMFDAQWYLKHNPDVKKAGLDPLQHYCEKGWKEGRQPCANFDGRQYLQMNQDVADAGIEPFAHYLKYGKKEGRIIPFNHTSQLYFSECTKGLKLRLLLSRVWGRNYSNSHNSNIDVLFISSLSSKDGVFIWRSNFFKEYLERFNIKAECESLISPSVFLFERFYAAKIVIFNRPTQKDLCWHLIKLVHRLNKIMFFDIDDLLLPEYSAYSGAFLSNNISYVNISGCNLATMSSFFLTNKIIVSTECLKKNLQKVFNADYITYHNKISFKYVLDYPKQVKSSLCLKLLYASGSSTHDYDFSKIYLPLLNFLSKYSDVSLTILGNSKVGNDFSIIGNRLKIIPKVDYSRMLSILEEHDLLLVPLDCNEFNHCKSNIKYIEAGARGTPVLVSECQEFKNVIKNRVNGFLYNDSNLYEQLEYIYKNREVLHSIGEKARLDVIQNHTTHSQSEDIVGNTIKELLSC